MVVPNQESERITPSVVLFDGDSVIVGNTAKEAAKVEPHRVVSRVKQHMGDPHFVFEHEGQAYSPEDISSFILRKVVGDAEIALGGDEKITDVVITCPAYFGTDEREATANAGRLAGLNVRAILNEPTAAAIAYGLEQGEDQIVLVYDLGGGTFDVTMIEIKDRLIRVICTGGDHRLGGALWDEAIVLHLAEEFRAQTGEESDPMDDPEVLNDLFLQAERGKKTLTQRDKAPFRVTHAGKQARVELDRPQFEAITRHLLDRTVELTREMLADARAKGHERFDKIILVGGATRMPQVRDRIVAEFGVEPESYDPDEAVAKGAALYRPEGVAPGRGPRHPRPREPRRRGEAAARPRGRLRGPGGRGPRQDRARAGLHPDRPGPRAGQHPDRQRPLQEPRRGRPRRVGQGRGRLPPPAERRGPDGKQPATSGPTRPTSPASTSGSWPASATAPSRSTARTSAWPP